MDYLTGITGRQVLGSLLFVCLFSCCFVFSAAGAGDIGCDLLYSQFCDCLADNGDPSCGSPEILTPAVTASEPTHEICVKFAKGNIGEYNYLYLAGYAIEDCDGYTKAKRNDNDPYHPCASLPSWWGKDYGIEKIDLSKTELNCNEPFKKVMLFFILKRTWGSGDVFSWERNDRITLDVTEYITSTDSGKNTFSFDVKQDFGSGEADRVDIFDLQGHRFVHFPKTEGTQRERLGVTIQSPNLLFLPNLTRNSGWDGYLLPQGGSP